MAGVTIYTTLLCPYCHSAKRLLKGKDIAYSEIDVTFNPSGRRDMMALAGRSSVPQIFIGDTHVGGCDELYALEGKGELDGLLAS
jgi:glutaredoxin 3